MNGDILTDLDYADLVRHHRESSAIATIASYVRNVPIDFGVIETDKDGWLSRYIEKPDLTYQVSMGIYVFEPRLLDYLERDKQFDFPDLVKLLLAEGERVSSYPFSGYWLDMGRPDDYARAVEEFETRKEQFLPAG
jgi:NDP-sugar pyrophosphorylase family protein